MTALLAAATLLLVLVAAGDASDAAGRQPQLGMAEGGLASVELEGGRRFTGQLDPLTDPSRLWMRFSRPGVLIRRGIDWSEVAAVELHGERYSAAELLSLIDQIRRERAVPPAVRGGLAWPEEIARPAAARPQTPPVQTIVADAEARSWDADAEVDGLSIALWPLTADGTVRAARGTLTVELFAARARVAPSSGRAQLIGRWTRAVDSEDFESRGAQYRLEYKSVDPDRDLMWAPYGLVRVKLSVPGEGTFATEVADVRIRSCSAFRDRLQIATGRRTP